MAGVHVLEQAVLDAVGRHEDHAGRIPGLLVHQAAHGLGAAAGDVLDVGQQLQRPAPEGRPGTAVDRPAQVGPGLGRMAVGGALRDHAAGDGDALDLGRGVGERHVHDQAGAAGIGQLRRPGRRQDRTRGDRQPAGGAGPVLEDVEDAVPGRVASGQEGRPGRPGVRRQARAGDALAAALDQRRQVGQLARREQRIEDLPVGAVPADDQHAVCHARTLVRASLSRLQW